MGLPLGDVVGSFLTTLVSVIVLGITVLLILYKTIDGEFRPVAGILAIASCLIILVGVVKPPHPALPAIALIVVISLVAFFPYALTIIEQSEMRVIDTEQLEKAYNSLAARPDNTAARFEVAKLLHAHGLREHAVAIASSAISALSGEVDPVHNRSYRDLYHNEGRLLQRWQMELTHAPKVAPAGLICPTCKRRNEVGALVCAGCQRPYLVDIARSATVRDRIISRLVISWAAVAVFFIGSILLVLSLEGALRWVALLLAMAITGAFITWVLRPNKIAA